MNRKKHTICPNCGGRLHSESIGWRCEKCRGFISLQDGKFYEYKERAFMPPMTNADKIRAMSDFELRQFICGCNRCKTCRWYAVYCCKLMGWLKEEAEEAE